MRKEFLVISVGIVCMGVWMGPDARAQVSTWRLNTASDGSQTGPNDWNGECVLSEDGRYSLFSSRSGKLVPGITGAYYDQFVKDRLTGVTTCVSVDSSGNGSNGLLWWQVAGVSRDGRFACYESDADNLVPNDTNGAVDIFVHDRQTGITTRVSVDSAGTEANGMSRSACMTEDGRWVAFSSAATNLVPNDTNGYSDVFLHDRQNATTIRVSVRNNGDQANWGDSRWGGMYVPDAQIVVFESDAKNLVRNDTNNQRDIFVRDLVAGKTTRVSVKSNGDQVFKWSYLPCASDDGRYVFFNSPAVDLVPNDTNNREDVFMHDRQNGTTVRVSVDVNGVEGDADAAMDSWSRRSCTHDGRFVVFSSGSAYLVPGDLNNAYDTFVKDTQTGAIRLVSLAWDGSQNNSRWGTYFSSMSRDGRFQAFKTGADNMVPNDTNGKEDVFAVGPHLTLEANPETVTAGANLTLTTWTGSPTTQALLATVAVNGAPMFAPLQVGSLDALGIWAVSSPAPPFLSGNTVTMMSFGFTPPGTVATTNQETVTFQ